ncbi:MAG: LuxR C-terminal-related transcriptional regulator [Labilithrix sp.]
MGTRIERIVEAVYSFGASEEAWLEGVVDALEPYRLSGGVVAYTSSLGEATSLRTLVNRSDVSSADVRANAHSQPPPLYRRFHSPMPVNYSPRFFPQVADEFGIDYERVVRELPYELPIMWGVCGGDAGIESALVTFSCKAGEELAARDRRTLDAVGAHLGSALRLRSVFSGSIAPARSPSGDHPAVEAVLAPDGKVLEARDELRDADARAPLIDALRRSERASLRRATPEERLDVWTALIQCRWSIVETVERDGKRMHLVCRNDPRGGSLRALTERERLVVSLAALGHPYKYVAYELGIPLSSVAATLKTALAKLGLASRAELIRLYARVVAQGPVGGPTEPPG